MLNEYFLTRYLQSGRRLRKPEYCPPQLYDIMLQCWIIEEEDRPDFSELTLKIQAIYDSFQSGTIGKIYSLFTTKIVIVTSLICLLYYCCNVIV